MLSGNKQSDGRKEQFINFFNELKIIGDGFSEHDFEPSLGCSESVFFVRNGLCIDQNLAAEKQFGYSISEAKNRPFTDWIHSDCRKIAEKNIRKGMDVPFASKTIKKDGKSFSCEISSKRLYFYNEPVFLVIIKNTDLNYSLKQERKKTISLLNASQRLSKVSVWKWENESKALFCTQEICTIFEIEQNNDEISEQINKVIECFSPEDRLIISEGFNQCVKYAQSFEHKCLVTTKRGKRKRVRIIANADKKSDQIVSVIGYIIDISDMCRAEDLLKARLKLLEKSHEHGITDFLQKAIDEAELLTESSIGFYHFLEADEKTISLQAWSANTLKNNCRAKGLGEHYNISKAGVWVDCVRERRAIIHNDYNSLPYRKGTPEGHSVITRELVVPVFRKNKIIAILGVGNKLTPYTEDDVKMVSQLADFVWDFAERIKIEESIQENIKAFETSFLTSPDAMTITELDGNYYMVNDKFFEITGYSKEEILDKNCLLNLGLWVNEEDRKKMYATLDKKGNIRNLETNFRTKNGKIIRGLLSARIIKVYNKKCLLTITRDITKLKEIEKKLDFEKRNAEEKEHKSKTLIENSPIGILLFDIEGKILEANKSILDIMGSPSKEKSLTMNFFNFDGVINSNLYFNAKKCINTKKSVSDETPYSSFWGKTPYIRYNLSPILRKNKVTAVIASIEDISDLYEIRKRLIEEKEKAEESDRLKTVFLRNMSHELRTPMSGIIGFSKLFMKPDITPDKRKEYAEIVIKSGNQLMGMINDILDISRIEAGKIFPKYEYINVNELLSDLYNFYIRETEKNNIQLILENNLKNEECCFKTDKVRINQILCNLIGNALKFTKNGYVKFGCKLLTNKDNSLIQFFVLDTGVGISIKDQNTIFEPFNQGSSDINKNLGGTGLGLSIAKNLVKMLGGEIWLNSKINEGAAFYFNLPYTTPSPIKTTSVKKISKQKKAPPPITILLAEDQAINYLYMKEIIEDMNINLIHVWNGLEAVKMCKKHLDINLVLMDLKMPEMDGFEATIEIKKHFPNIPVIALSAYAMGDDKINAEKAGCEGFISKPVDLDILKKAIDKYR